MKDDPSIPFIQEITRFLAVQLQELGTELKYFLKYQIYLPQNMLETTVIL